MNGKGRRQEVRLRGGEVVGEAGEMAGQLGAVGAGEVLEGGNGRGEKANGGSAETIAIVPTRPELRLEVGEAEGRNLLVVEIRGSGHRSEGDLIVLRCFLVVAGRGGCLLLPAERS